jgi:hypothetical protein
LHIYGLRAELFERSASFEHHEGGEPGQLSEGGPGGLRRDPGGAGAEKSSCARGRIHPKRRRTAPIRLLTNAANTMIARIAITSNAKPA